MNSKEESGNTALITAAKNFGTTEVIKILLTMKNIDVNAQNENGTTALMNAVSVCHVEAVEILLKRKDIDLYAKSYDTKTALDMAISKEPSRTPSNQCWTERTEKIVKLLKGEELK